MIKDLPKELFDKTLITEAQYKAIEPIASGKLVSVFYELRMLLYLGVMLLTTGLGILIYQNIGDLGHVISIGALCVITGICFWYVFKRQVPYSKFKVKAISPYFDYILLLGCLLTIAIQGYLQFQYEIFDNALGASTLFTAGFFFFIAYRYDHLGILSMAITALASFWSINVSPQKWYSANFFSSSSHHITAIVFSLSLVTVAMFLDKKSVKDHFTFTYVNFCSLIFFVGTTAGLFIDGQVYLIYLLLLFAGCIMAFFYAKSTKSFLILLYAFVFGYIGTTYLLADTLFAYEPLLWFFYSMLSCGGFIFFIIKYKTLFTRQ